MGESDGEDYDSEDWVYYRDRPEWKDVEPVPQDDGPFPVARIAYTEKFRDVHDYLRAIIFKNELSERALELTESAIDLNAANYTAWEYRRRILKAINYNLHKELYFTRQVIEENPKNYQVWHHRQKIVDWLQDPSAELLTIEIMLSQDSKNYHAWQYRQWVIQTFRLYDKEFEYIEHCLMNDVRNNSAWNHRYFVISNTTGFSEDVVQREVSWAREKIAIVPGNESGWNYLRGVVKHTSKERIYPDLEQFCKEMIEKNPNCSHAYGLLIDIWTYYMQSSEVNIPIYLEEATKACQLLANKVDCIRAEYWGYIERKGTREFGSLLPNNGSGDHLSNNRVK